MATMVLPNHIYNTIATTTAITNIKTDYYAANEHDYYDWPYNDYECYPRPYGYGYVYCYYHYYDGYY